MKDFLGQEYEVGDTIVYAGMSGRSVQMVLATVVKFNDSGSVSVQPIGNDSRWRQHHGRVRYVDSRTGKGIDPYATDKHTAKPVHYIHEDTGEEISGDELEKRFPPGSLTLGRYGGQRQTWTWAEKSKWEFQPAVWKDYVQQVVTGAPVVTLHITENIIKVAAPAASVEPDAACPSCGPDGCRDEPDAA